MAEKELFSKVEQIISVLESGERQDVVILIIPSHDKENKPLKDQELWANSALDLFADLYTGGTAFETFAGIYKDDKANIYRDKPILVEAYVKRSRLVDRDNLLQLLEFAKRMGREARQQAVGLIINDVFHEITDF
jgi:hypothetical protein